jgi:L-threonylcarbamoyladenylate synthase
MRQFTIDPLWPDKQTVIKIADMVRQGGTLVYPTETIYGLGGDAFNPQTIEAVYALKGRDTRKPLSVIIPSAAWVERLAAEITPAARNLMNNFWPGPLTIVFKAAPGVPAALTANSGTIAVRVSSLPFCSSLALAANCPLIATSANLAGGANCLRVQDLPPGIMEQADAVVDGGVLTASLASMVVDATGKDVKILREGAVGREQINLLLSKISIE